MAARQRARRGARVRVLDGGVIGRVVVRVIAVVVPLLLVLVGRPASADDAARGAKILDRRGCISCHSTDGAARVGPTFRGLYGSTRKVKGADGVERDVVADDAFVARAVREPDAEIAAGFPSGNMPRYALGDAELRDVIAALRAMRGAMVEGTGGQRASLVPLLLSVTSFVGFHFLLSAIHVRKRLVGALTQRGFGALYSVVAAASFVGIVWFFRSAPYVEVWVPPRWTRWIPVLAMPVSLTFLVLGFSTPGPTTVAQGRRANDDDVVRGIQAVTRHPALWGFAIWAASHLATNGELSVILVAGGILVLALGGMKHIDARRAHELGDAWRPFAERTSVVPFVAIARGRAALRWRDIGVPRLVIAAVLYVAVLHTHALIIGASPFP